MTTEPKADAADDDDAPTIPEDVFTNDIEGARLYEEMRSQGIAPSGGRRPEPDIGTGDFDDMGTGEPEEYYDSRGRLRRGRGAW